MITKFKLCEPEDKEQELISELLLRLRSVTDDFMESKFNSEITSECIAILRDAAMGYAGNMILYLNDIISEQDQKVHFIKEVKHIFNLYLDRTKESKNDLH